MPSAKAVGGAFVVRVSEIPPRAVFGPVRQMSALAEPLTTVVPMRRDG